MLRKCPDHNFGLNEQVLYFYDGVRSRIRNRLNAGAGGDLLGLDCQSVWDKIELLAREDELYPDNEEASSSKKVACIEEVGEGVVALEPEVGDVNYVGNHNQPRVNFHVAENFPKRPNPAQNAHPGIYQAPRPPFNNPPSRQGNFNGQGQGQVQIRPPQPMRDSMLT